MVAFIAMGRKATAHFDKTMNIDNLFRNRRKKKKRKEEEEEDLDNFDCLPGAFLLIFNKLQETKSLTKCLLVSERFSFLVPFNTIFISIPSVQHLFKPNTASYVNTLRLLVNNLFLKPLKCFHQITNPKSAATRSFYSSYYQPNGVLNNFKEIKSLHLELPSHGEELGSGSGASFLKWKAALESYLKSCIILGATSFERSNKFSSSFCYQQNARECIEETLTDYELNLRVIWTIPCLICSSTRHYLFKQILLDHPIPMLHRVQISDAYKKGKFYFGKQGLVDMRNSMNSQQEILESSSLERTPALELSIRLWYLPML
ncbi:F-box protein At1g30200-like [Durio zibethinus]|uniref:F-box protein At1g30200-like n=1 Tax=Durio zibethinus TaxID=66656 RepID=A0A6P5ZNZ5_DURZI|nr:F-box protein At1g30200-like [Durio zibethinus]